MSKNKITLRDIVDLKNFKAIINYIELQKEGECTRKYGDSFSYYIQFTDITAGIKTGVLLSYLMRKWEFHNLKEFRITHERIRCNTKLSKEELVYALNKLKNFGFITVTMKGTPRSSYFILHEDKIQEALSLYKTKA